MSIPAEDENSRATYPAESKSTTAALRDAAEALRSGTSLHELPPDAMRATVKNLAGQVLALLDMRDAVLQHHPMISESECWCHACNMPWPCYTCHAVGVFFEDEDEYREDLANDGHDDADAIAASAEAARVFINQHESATPR